MNNKEVEDKFLEMAEEFHEGNRMDEIENKLQEIEIELREIDSDFEDEEIMYANQFR